MVKYSITKIYFTVYYTKGEPIGVLQPRVHRDSSVGLRVMVPWKRDFH
jgi:hypothetical protein